MSRPRKPRPCRCCGGKLPPDRLRVCESCQAAGLAYHMDRYEPVDREELYAVAVVREARGLPPLEGMSMEEISALAWLFRKSGYGTYGKLRGYVESTGKLPPRLGQPEEAPTDEPGRQWRGGVPPLHRRRR